MRDGNRLKADYIENPMFFWGLGGIRLARTRHVYKSFGVAFTRSIMSNGAWDLDTVIVQMAGISGCIQAGCLR
jgi:hypothetical protein